MSVHVSVIKIFLQEEQTEVIQRRANIRQVSTVSRMSIVPFK